MNKIVQVLVRPSFVLSGAAMSVACNAEQLKSCLADAEEVSADKPVVISKYHVIRSYGCASDIAKLGIKWLSREAKTELLYAATDTISIYELARKITNLYNLNPIESDIDENLSKDDYSCETYVFKNYLKTFGIKITNIEKQIQETFEYI